MNFLFRGTLVRRPPTVLSRQLVLGPLSILTIPPNRAWIPVFTHLPPFKVTPTIVPVVVRRIGPRLRNLLVHSTFKNALAPLTRRKTVTPRVLAPVTLTVPCKSNKWPLFANVGPEISPIQAARVGLKQPDDGSLP